MDQIENNESGLSIRTKLNTLVDRYNLKTVPETVVRLIYVETVGNGGNDTTGDGTISAPFATIYRALQDIQSIVLNVRITIKIGVGGFDYDNNCKKENK